MADIPRHITDVLRSPELVNRLAAVEHERWAHWQRYVHSKCVKGLDGSLTIPAELVGRWERQISTSFDELSESEKESDRIQVHRYMLVITDVLSGRRELPR